jgi:cytochrome oxidase assembly protein ShyY1
MQSVDGKLVYQALSAFRTDSGDTLLVNRGWVRVGDNNAVPDFPSAPTRTHPRLTSRESPLSVRNARSAWYTSSPSTDCIRNRTSSMGR